MLLTNDFTYMKNAFWKVNEKKFNNKFDALLEATRLKANVTFHYYDNIFESVNKSLLGKQDLNNLYRLRAQQLRDEYDYLILYFSGGSDSYNILKTFTTDLLLGLSGSQCDWNLIARAIICSLAASFQHPSNKSI